jgi:hypothetical protein
MTQAAAAAMLPRLEAKAPVYGDGQDGSFPPHEWFTRFEAFIRCFPNCSNVLTLAGEPESFDAAAKSINQQMLLQLMNCVRGSEWTLIKDCNTVKKAWDKLKEV